MTVSPHTMCTQHPVTPRQILTPFLSHPLQAIHCGVAATASAQPRRTLHRALSCQLGKPLRLYSRHWVSCRRLALGAARGCTTLRRG